jgi:hypothetical protein
MRAPDDPVIVGTVYDPATAAGDASRLGLPPWPEVVDVLAKLNNGLPAIAEEHRARIAEIHDQFLRHARGRQSGPTRGTAGQPRPLVLQPHQAERMGRRRRASKFLARALPQPIVSGVPAHSGALQSLWPTGAC